MLCLLLLEYGRGVIYVCNIEHSDNIVALITRGCVLSVGRRRLRYGVAAVVGGQSPLMGDNVC